MTTGKTLAHTSVGYKLRTLSGIILIFSTVLVSALVQGVPALASTYTGSVAQDNCPAGARPDSNSILGVLLDRSGSLVAGNEPTDPDGYSGSATKALADLWPGQIALIPFGKDQEPIIGPFAHASSGITSLKQYIDSNPPDPNANTPLRPAMDQAKTLFSNGIPTCSKLVLITDGVPDAPSSPQQEVNMIESPQEIGWFHNHGIPISVFGLKIDKNTSDGQMADRLLNAIETGTGAGTFYDSVQSANNLASEVTGLYAKWRGLSFAPIAEDTVNNTYPVSIDPFVDQATIISFYEQGVQNNPITKNGQAIPQNSFEQTKDQHYEIDNILDPSHNAGTYIISTVGNAATSVYALVDSNLTLGLIPPQNVVNTGQSLSIQAHFLNSGSPVVTGSTSPLTAMVTISFNGRPSQSTTVLLYPAQGSDLYTGSYKVPTTGQKPGKTAVNVGSLSISVNGTATFQGSSAKRGTSTTTIQVDVAKAPPPPPPPPPPPCKAGVAQCFWIHYHTQIIIAIPVVIILLLVLLLLWWVLTTPFVGSVSNIEPVQPNPMRQRGYVPPSSDDGYSNNVVTIHLGEHRTFINRLLHRGMITSNELKNYRAAKGILDFQGAQFQLVAGRASQTSDGNKNAGNKKRRAVFLKPTSNFGEIALKRMGQTASITNPTSAKATAYGGDSTTVTKSRPSSNRQELVSVTSSTPLLSGDIVRISGQDNFRYS